MAMFYEEENNLLRFDVPNSEAAINAQHHGIVNRTVGSYYMSDRYEFCEEFFNGFTGEYYIDLELCIVNTKRVIEMLSDKKLHDCFKEHLKPQKNQIEALRWMKNYSNNFYKITPPTVNEKRKYLKLDFSDQVVEGIRTLLLGDLMSLFFKKIGKDGYVVYIDESPRFKTVLESNEILKWKK